MRCARWPSLQIARGHYSVPINLLKLVHSSSYNGDMGVKLRLDDKDKAPEVHKMTTLIKAPSVAFMLPILVSNVNMSVTKGRKQSATRGRRK
jgi:hypothetical protein